MSFKYLNNDGVDEWNCVCSALNWIEMGIEYVNSEWKRKGDNINIECVKLYTYISCIDMIWEAVIQLHRVFVSKKTIPFHGDKECFEKRLMDCDDNVYFKTLRACFGAHPVNLKDPHNEHDKKLRRFSSWPNKGNSLWTDGDYSVMLYSNIPDEDDIFLDIKIRELDKFAKKRYGYLNDLIHEIDRKESEHNHYYKSIVIPKSENILAQVTMLQEALKVRAKNSYYDSTLQELAIIFNTETQNASNQILLEKYKTELKKVIDEIYTNLQTMKLYDLKTDYILNPEYPVDLHYSYEKLTNNIWGGSSLYAQEPIMDTFKDLVDFNEVEDIYEYYALVLAATYYKFNNDKSIN